MDRIAVVGLSDDAGRPSHQIARYLISAGKQVVPVNPSHPVILGLRCYRSLRDIPDPVELVNVFRRSEFCEEVARSAIAAGAKGIWLQSGVRNAAAERLALAAGIDFVQDRCIMVEHMRRQ